MRLFNSLFALLPLSASAALDVFDDYRTKSFPIKLTDANFQDVTSAPRDYATVVLLTAMDNRFGCAACREFQPEWDLLARSWQRGDRKGESKVLFTTIDFADGRDTFTSLKLQHAPVVMLYPPTTGPNGKGNAEPARFDFSG
jgi:oligosaccharyltransferase complex subunit gamma